jgi:hypothetical protein
LPTQSGGDLLLGNRAQLNQACGQPNVIAPLILNGLFELVGRKQILTDEDFA